MRKILIFGLILLSASANAQFMGGFGGGFGGFGMGASFQASQTRNAVDFKSSNLPIVMIDTDGKPIDNMTKASAAMKIIDNKTKRNSISDKANGYNGAIGIKLRGESSLMFEQKSFTIELRDSNGRNLEAPLLDMPAESGWALIAPYNDISMIRNSLAFDMWTEMGYWGPRTRMVELVFDGKYQGVYILAETVMRDKNRLDIANLKADDNNGTELTGGYILRIDAYDADDLTFTSKVSGIMGRGGFGGRFSQAGLQQNRVSNPIVWTIRTPKKDKITEAQRKYIENYIHETEAAIQGQDFANPEKGYAKYISVSSFVDYLIHTEVSLNADGMKRSTYFYKTKQNPDGTGGKLHAGPVWDYNLAYGNCSFANAGNIRAWVHEGAETMPTTFMWKRLMEDPVFVSKVKTRYSELRKTVLSLDNIYNYIDGHAALLEEAQSRQYTQYPDLLVPESGSTGSGNANGGAMGFPGMGGFPSFGGGAGGFGGGGMAKMFSAYSVSSYAQEIRVLKDWFKDRLEFLDSQWLINY